ncbi:site-specific DNA-methyltransferase [Mitsuokella jalaludinii]|uniref:DNA-methyltransferase n=1 Tax=Mitsuokella jalaludinii TaxID=187979 RepID=UPI00307B04BD
MIENRDGRRCNTTVYHAPIPRRGHHPTEKPTELLKWLIGMYTRPGDTVLDNCMGSGSTGVACLEMGRDFVGIERDEKYFEIARERIGSTKRV